MKDYRLLNEYIITTVKQDYDIDKETNVTIINEIVIDSFLTLVSHAIKTYQNDYNTIVYNKIDVINAIENELIIEYGDNVDNIEVNDQVFNFIVDKIGEYNE